MVQPKEQREISYLLVDDDMVDTMAIQRAFKRSNVDNPLYTAASGLEALDLLNTSSELRSSSHIVILLDLNMPKMTGVEFLSDLRKDPCLHMIPVVVLTTSTEERDRADTHNFNVFSYIVKPVKFSGLVEIVETLNQYLSYCELPSTTDMALQPVESMERQQ